MTGFWTRRWVPVVLVVVALLPCGFLLAGLHCVDVEVYRAGGQAVLDARPLYDVRVHEFGFTYPPFAALLGVLVALMPQGAAIAVLTVGSLASLVVVLRYSAGDLLRQACRAPTLWRVVGVVALIVCAPVHSTLWNGQIELILAALVLSDMQGRRWRGAGVGLAAAIKLTPAIFVLYLLVRGRWREARNAIGAFVIVTAATWIVLPGSSTRYWTKQVFNGGGLGQVSHLANQSLYAVVVRDVGPPAAGLVWALLVVPTVVIGLHLARQASRFGREPLALGIVGVTGCLVSPVSWLHHWVWCIPLLAGLMQVLRSRGRASRAWLVVLVVVFAASLMTPSEFRDLPPVVSSHAFVVPVLLTAVGYGLQQWRGRSWRLRRVGRRADDRPTVGALHSPGGSAKPEVGTRLG